MCTTEATKTTEAIEAIEIEDDDEDEELIAKLEKINEFRRQMNCYPDYILVASEMFNVIHSLAEMANGNREIAKAVGKLIKLSIDNENAIISYVLETKE